jgi:hypothetical protein
VKYTASKQTRQLLVNQGYLWPTVMACTSMSVLMVIYLRNYSIVFIFNLLIGLNHCSTITTKLYTFYKLKHKVDDKKKMSEWFDWFCFWCLTPHSALFQYFSYIMVTWNTYQFKKRRFFNTTFCAYWCIQVVFVH